MDRVVKFSDLTDCEINAVIEHLNRYARESRSLWTNEIACEYQKQCNAVVSELAERWQRAYSQVVS